MKEISMLELRTNAKSVILALRKGLSLTLTYRGKPLARLEPIRGQSANADDDPLFSLSANAINSPDGDLDHSKIDDLLYD